MLYKSHLEVPVFKLAHKLTLEIYRATEKFPRSEIYGIISQLRRAMASIPANIVEGFYRKSRKELIQFLIISRGSCGEVRYFLLLSKDLGYVNVDKYLELDSLVEEIHKQLNGWIRSLKAGA
ncbi:hypothetical protein A3H03_01060 [Candidatus Kuenenbacteria bacterium RIFCSPLOWO2_12_FULL_42_13]|uniref:Four helix bundle protein n=1 Tax=Candidatus Kuenenbacteria bacterium RIFCSPLOWO2_12_FULL_42_13 TaxID=1798565 RepID=A0A1F6G1F3_9BACT|nr:MAG: hypothetical protein A3H03_01060 [Candidatus Kuenenbacteria bacterium RIFCSPLOWO2_12_FULL_42_13]